MLKLLLPLFYRWINSGTGPGSEFDSGFDSPRPDQNPPSAGIYHRLIFHLDANPSLPSPYKGDRASRWKTTVYHVQAVWSPTVILSVDSVYFVSEVGRVSPQTCSSHLAADQQKMGEVVRAVFGREWEKGFVDVQAYSGRVTLYLIIHFHAWTSESPGGLSKKHICGLRS